MSVSLSICLLLNYEHVRHLRGPTVLSLFARLLVTHRRASLKKIKLCSVFRFYINMRRQPFYAMLFVDWFICLFICLFVGQSLCEQSFEFFCAWRIACPVRHLKR